VCNGTVVGRCFVSFSFLLSDLLPLVGVADSSHCRSKPTWTDVVGVVTAFVRRKDVTLFVVVMMMMGGEGGNAKQPFSTFSLCLRLGTVTEKYLSILLSRTKK
jgi:hypothetical protein